MSSRGKKRVPHAFGAGRGDRGGVNGGRSLNFRGPLHFEGSYKNRYLVHAITSLIGCIVELRKVNGEVYRGVLRTVSPQVDIVLEMANLEDKAVKKSSLIKTLCLPWSEVVAISSVSSSSSAKDIFKIDSEIGTHSNGVAGARDLQPFEFDDSSVDGNLVGEEGWDPEAMFDTNKSKFNVSTSFDPNMGEYTTTLVLQDNEEDMKRVLVAERKAKEIEDGMKYQSNGMGTDDIGTEEKLFSAVVVPDTAQEPLNDVNINNERKNWNEPPATTTQNKDEPPTSTQIKNEPPASIQTRNEPPPATKNRNEPSQKPLVEESESKQSSDTTTLAETGQAELPCDAAKEPVESETKPHEPQSQTVSETKPHELQSQTVSETKPHELQSQTVAEEGIKKPTSFKLNPDAMEFKPSISSDTPTVSSNSSPPNPQPSFSYGGSGSRVFRPRGPRGPRPSSYSDQQSLYGYQMPVQSGLRQVIHTQAGLATGQLPAHLTSPTNLQIMRQPIAAPIIGQQGHLFSPIAQSGIGQQLYIPASQSTAAMFGHAHHSLAPTLPQSQVLYLQAPLPPQSFAQQGYIPSPQLGGGAATGGLIGYTQSKQ